MYHLSWKSLKSSICFPITPEPPCSPGFIRPGAVGQFKVFGKVIHGPHWILRSALRLCTTILALHNNAAHLHNNCFRKSALVLSGAPRF